ncbi:MAG: LexA family transcriptional regulator [Candidatus Roizmanbacteria bacterium]|nr:LexA family transcriptional regulator [Candidatus Roizmanbacteria bacterium]
MSDIHNRLQKIKEFYTTNRRLPTYTEMLTLFGFSSRNAVFKLVHKWIEEGILEKMGNRLAPTEQFFALPVLGFIQAGTPTIHGDYYSEESISLDQYLVPNPGFTFLLRVSGDSMINAGIHEGDLVILDNKRAAKPGDIVAALVDNEWTLKYFNRANGKTYLTAANPAYAPIHPKENLMIGGVVVKVIKEYY